MMKEKKIVPVIATEYCDKVLPFLQAARTSIDIVMYEWKWYSHAGYSNIQRVALGVAAAARRGVKVRVILDIEHSSHPITKINTRTAKFLRQAGVQVKFAFTSQITHAKMFVIDSSVLILGSHNLTKGALARNQEASIILAGFPEVENYQKWFDSLWRRF